MSPVGPTDWPGGQRIPLPDPRRPIGDDPLPGLP